jgi:hypothetical protein
MRRGVHHHVACWIGPRLQVTFFALLEDFYSGRLTVKDQDKTLRIAGVILITLSGGLTRHMAVFLGPLG